MPRALYDDIGRTYRSTRQPDPRIEAAIWRALGDAKTVLNVGAGTGSYEPPDRSVTAVEPSNVMISQRPAHAHPVVRGNAEALPFPDQSFDACLAVLSDHHWKDRARGLRELRRVARRRIVLFNTDPAEFPLFWMNDEYLPFYGTYLLPDAYTVPGFWRQELEQLLGPVSFTPVPIPHDCIDGFYGAFWKRPETFLDPNVRAGISVFAKLPDPDVAAGMDRLERDIASGRWREAHPHLLDATELHLGYYVIVAELPGP